MDPQKELALFTYALACILIGLLLIAGVLVYVSFAVCWVFLLLFIPYAGLVFFLWSVSDVLEKEYKQLLSIVKKNN